MLTDDITSKFERSKIEYLIKKWCDADYVDSVQKIKLVEGRSKKSSDFKGEGRELL